MTPPVLRPYDSYQGAQPLADVWTLHKSRRTMRCALATHRLGWELRLTVGDEFIRSQVCKMERDVFDVSREWRAAAEAKAWSGS